MATSIIQPSFAAGEVSPSLFGRVDLAKYRTGVQTARNFFVDYRGGLSTRAGTAIVGVGDPVMQAEDVSPYLIPFKFNADQAYLLELNQHFMRIIVDGGYIINSPIAIAGIASVNPLALNVPGSNFAAGQTIVVDTSVVGALRSNGISGINGRSFVVTSVAGNVVTVGGLTASEPIDASHWTAYASGGNVASIYTVITPWAAADVPALVYAQSADVLTITHVSYPTYNIERFGQTDWRVAPLTIGTALVAPGSQVATPIQGTPSSGQVLPSAAFFYVYAVTAFDYATGEESSINTQCTCSNLALDQNIGTVNVITWAAIAGATGTTYYRVYKAQEVPVAAASAGPFFFGYIGQTQSTTFVDMNLEADFTTVAPLNTNPFTGGNNPGCVAYFMQRRVLAAFASRPSSFEMSKPGNYNNFDKSYPSNAGDAISGSIVAEEVNAIGSLTPMASGLIALTADGAFQISGGTPGAAITPATIQAQPQAFSGAAPLRPLKIETDLLYLQARGSAVRDLAYNFYVNVYTGSDVSALSSHLLENRTIVQWAFAQEPFKIVWCVRDDGVLLSFTYLKEQELYGWARHDTCGLVKSVCVIPEGKEDVVYLVVKRFVGDHFSYMTERMVSRHLGENSGFNMPSSTLDAWCVDAGVRQAFYNPNSDIIVARPLAPNTFGSLAPWLIETDLPVFQNSYVGATFRVGGGKGVIVLVVNGMQAVVNMTIAPPGLLPNAPTTVVPPTPAGSWSIYGVTSALGGLDHLNGSLVSILADGVVQPPQVVQDGCITLNPPASEITAGHGYTCQVQTLRLDVGEPTIQGKRKNITSVTVRVRDTRGISVGPTFATLDLVNDANFVNELDPLVLQGGGGSIVNAVNGLISSIPYANSDQRINIENDWNEDGLVCIEQAHPLPATILAIIPEIMPGDS